MLAGLFGGGAATAAVPAFQTYQANRRNEVRQKEAFAKQPQVQREIDYFNKKIEEMKSPEDLFKDRRAMAYVLSAYGMDEELNLMGRMKKILTEDPKDRNALANKLIDPRFKEIATGLSIHNRGLSKMQLTVFQDELKEKYLANEYEKSLGQQNPALRQAAYFKRKIGEVSDIYQVLGDRNLRAVATTALGLPQEIVYQSIEKQRELVGKGLKISDMKDSRKLETFVQRFLIQADLRSQQTGFGGGNAFALNLFA